MYLRSLLSAGVIAAGANALLVVPEFEPDAISHKAETLDILPFSAYAPYHKQVDLLCTECPFRETGHEGEVSWTDGSQTSLSLNFSVEDAALLANGRQIFPPPPPTHITATQRRVQDGAESEPIPLGYALEVMPVSAPPDEPNVRLLSLRFTVLDLAGHPVPLDTVAISLILDAEGGLAIAKTEIEDNVPSNDSWEQCRGKPSCLRRLLFDRMRSLLASAKSRFRGMASKLPGSKGCHRPIRPFGHSRLSHDEFDPNDFTIKEHAGHPHSPYRMHPPHHMHHGGLERTVLQLIRFIVIPAILGVLAGLTASAVGMLVGRLIVSLWSRYRRGNSYQTSASLEDGTEIEKEGLMDSSGDLPPAYTDDGSMNERDTTMKE